jgi:hypothetical protein
MDAGGAQKLRGWLEQQEHWKRAGAVLRGEQPSSDPDAWELEEFKDDLRLYRVREEQRRVVDGRPSLVIQRLTKRLVGDRWETIYEVEKVRTI